MATLLLDWAINEGTGTTVAESKNGLDGYFASAGGYPQWVSGPSGSDYALRFSGSTNSGAWVGTDSPIWCQIRTDGATIMVKFRRTALTRGGGLIAAQYLSSSEYPATETACNPFATAKYVQYAIWIDDDSYLRIGTRSGNVSVSNSTSPIAVIDDTEWHTVVWRHSPNAYLWLHSVWIDGYQYGPNTHNRTELYIRYQKDCRVDNSNTPLNDAVFYNNFWMLGRFKYADNLEYYQGFCEGTNDSFYGDIAQAKVWCGQLSDTEIEQIFNSEVQPANAIMFSCNT